MPFDPVALFDHAYWAEGVEFGSPVDGSAVSTLPDEVGTSDATQATAGFKPLYVASVPEFLAHPAIRFDGSDDYLQTSAWAAQAPPFTIVLVGRWKTGINKGAGALADGRVATNKHAIAINLLHYLHMDDGVDSSTFDLVLTKEMPHIAVMEFNLDSSYFWLDGRLEYAGAAANPGGAGTGMNSSVGMTLGNSAAASVAAKALLGDLHFAGIKLGGTLISSQPSNLTDLVDWAALRGVQRNDSGIARRPRNYVAGSTASGSASASFATAPSNGQIIGAWVSSSGVHASVAGPDANWRKLVGRNNATNNLSISLWVKVAIGTETGAQTFTGTGSMQVQLFELAGLLADTASVLDVSATAEDNTNTVSQLTVGPVTPSAAPSAVVACVATQANGGEHRGSTGLFHTVLAAPTPRLFSADKMIVAAAAESSTISWNGATRCVGIVAVLKVAPPPPPLPAVIGNNASTDDLLLLRNIRRRQDSYQFELLDSTNQVIGSVQPSRMQTPTIQNDPTRRVFRTLTNFVVDAARQLQIETISARVRPRLQLQNGQTFNLGVFLFGDATRPRRSWGLELGATLVDALYILDQPVGRIVGYPIGTNAVAAALALAQEVITTPVLVTASAQMLGAPKAYQATETRQKIVNDLLASAGFLPVYFNNDGAMVMRPVPTFPAAQVDFSYESGERILKDSIVETDNLLSAPNRYVAVDTAATDFAIVGSYDLPASAPNSVTARGFPVVKVTSIQGLGSVSAAALAAQAEANSDESTFKQVEFDSTHEPRQDTFDVIDFLGQQYRDLGWKIDLRAGGRMSHRLRRVYS